MSRVLQGACFYCKHLKSLKIETIDKKSFYVCAAFPNGIPVEIEWAIYDHRRPHPEDNNIQFELKDKYTELPDWSERLYPSHFEQDESYHERRFLEAWNKK